MGENSTRFPEPIRVKIKQATEARSRMFKEALKAGVTIGFGRTPPSRRTASTPASSR